MNTAQYLLNYGSKQQIALITDREQISYDVLQGRVATIAVELQRLGVKPGDKVAILGANSVFWVACYIAVFHIGAIAVPLPTTIQPEEYESVKQFSEFRVICLTKLSARRLPGVVFDEQFCIYENDLESLPAASLTDIPEFPVEDMETEAAYMLTSGTTSKPKLVRVSHGNIIANSDSIVEYLKLDSDDRMMVAMPFYYCFGLSLLHTHLHVGGSLVLNNRFAYPESILDQMEETECTGFAGVPSMYHTLLRKSTFPKRPLRHLRKVQQAGGHLPPVLVQELRQQLPQAQVFVMYGQTEATARLSYLPPELLDSKLGSIGQAIPGVSLRVVDGNGNDVPLGEVGEIMAWGDNITLGYLNNPEATAKKYVNGGLKTGDLAVKDEDDFIFIVDRESDILKPNGMRVSSKKIESCIMEMPQLVNAAAVGVPNLETGEAIYVYAVLAPNSHVDEADVLQHCRQRLPLAVVPSKVEFIDGLPLNSNGKVVLSVLRERARESVGVLV
ncbi:MAG: AMP-binding protein [Ardenticatenaceae bacterium]|nr:AMP-binding protein [Ardenticatenaceae bacterium]MCB9445054.1 AMP-binding protein [Ardenticatenaceae bacterium]